MESDIQHVQTDESVTNVEKQLACDENLIGKWCVVSYEDRPYPGIVENQDEDEIEVNVMHKIGKNRYFWPMTEDVIWYPITNLLGVIPEPKRIGSRHFEINQDFFNLLDVE